jgi:hypothetical protein
VGWFWKFLHVSHHCFNCSFCNVLFPPEVQKELILAASSTAFWHENGVETVIKNQFFYEKSIFIICYSLSIHFIASAEQKHSQLFLSIRTRSKSLGWCRYYIQTFFSGNNAGEFIGYFWNRGFRLTGLYEIHGDFADAQGLKWYVGPGAHLGFYDYYDHHNNHIDGTYIGIDGVLGLDYKFNGAPINISIDWQPSFEFGDYVGFSHYGGLGIRYTF